MKALEPRVPPPGRALYLHLLALGALAFAQPLFDLFVRTPDFFDARRSGRADVWLLLALTLLVAPLPWLLAAFAARRWCAAPRAARIAAVLVGSLVALVVLRGLALSGAPGLVAVAASVAAGAGAGWCYLRTVAARQLASFLAVALIVVPVAFLIDPGVSRLLSPPAPPPPVHKSGARTPVVVAIFDELPLTSLLATDGTIDRARLPNFARLADEATWFRNAAAPSGETVTAIPAILTGRLRFGGDALQRQRNLYTLLGDYPTFAIDGQVCPREQNRLAIQRAPDFSERAQGLAADLPVIWLQLVTPPQWRRHLPSLAAGWEGFTGGAAPLAPRQRPAWVDRSNRRRNAERFLTSIAPAERALWVAHLGFPHVPWDHLPSGQVYGCEPECYAVPAEGDGWEVAQLLERHLLQVGYADTWLGQLVARLRRAGLYDRALLVVLADHGAAFQAGGRLRRLQPSTLGEVLSVPLLVKRPGQQRGAVVDDLVSTVDLLPTVVEELAIRPPWPVPGRSWFRGGREDLVYLSSHSVSLPMPRDLASLRQAAAARLARWRPGSDPWRIGPWPTLLGHQPPAPIADAAGMTFDLDRPPRYEAVDPHGVPLPLSISGGVAGATRGDGCCTMAFAVDGTVWATTHSYWTAEGEHRVAALVPPRALRAGRNEIEAYLVASDGTLRRMPRH
ncbi:MAG TPA: sulfatase-like hydrolase/transferase [Thermoanaerobaculia bacterium]|nr:sulfatase-like hydrolase/transferase [Thermoanaerobaculia bacterium]